MSISNNYLWDNFHLHFLFLFFFFPFEIRSSQNGSRIRRSLVNVFFSFAFGLILIIILELHFCCLLFIRRFVIFLRILLNTFKRQCHFRSAWTNRKSMFIKVLFFYSQFVSTLGTEDYT